MTTLKEKVFNRITEDFQVLAKIVIHQIDLTQQLLDDNQNEEWYTEINNNERIIDSLEVKIRDEVINTIVLYSPRATNLRMIISYYDMTAYLERIGDLILNISHFLHRTAIHEALFVSYKDDLAKMMEMAKNMTQNAIFAFTCEDIRLAKETIESDDRVDELHHRIRENLQHNCCNKLLTQQEMVDALNMNSMAYNIERIGDNATNIAEAAIYLIEGKNIKHWNNPPDDTLLAGSEG
ncbi:MAG: PhoU domain-containing protein [Odoribacter sp.]